jgi:hypothetical protein
MLGYLLLFTSLIETSAAGKSSRKLPRPGLFVGRANRGARAFLWWEAVVIE